MLIFSAFCVPLQAVRQTREVQVSRETVIRVTWTFRPYWTPLEATRKATVVVARAAASYGVVACLAVVPGRQRLELEL